VDRAHGSMDRWPNSGPLVYSGPAIDPAEELTGVGVHDRCGAWILAVSGGIAREGLRGPHWR
jgi:hypothetical protein